MNTVEKFPDRTAPKRRLCRSQFHGALAVAFLSVELVGCFRVSSDVGALRDSVMKSATAEWDEQIEFGFGAITINLARAGLGLVDLPPEARTALRAVRGAELGVYRRRGGREPLKMAAILRGADQTMMRRGWDRIVGVINSQELVAVYVPKESRSTRNVRVCLLTVNREELVVVSARSNLEPLLEMALNRPEWRRAARVPTQL